MTAEAWLAATDPAQMIGAVSDAATERKMRLFALSCCWRNEYLPIPNVERRQIPYEVAHRRKAIELLASRIEGVVSEHDFREALSNASNDAYGSSRDPSDTVGHAVYVASVAFHFILNADWERVVIAASEVPAYDALTRSSNSDLEQMAAFWRVHQPGLSEDRWARDMRTVQELPEYVSALKIEQRNQASLLRDIFGNPFRPVVFDTAWRSEHVVGLARGIYDDRAFELLPILADALEDAGCDDADILNHCRQPGEHVRGCWVVDLVLGKE